MRHTRLFLAAVAILMLGAYGTQAKRITADIRGIAVDTIQAADDDSVAPGEMFIDNEELPEYPGGNEAMQEYIKSNKRYPQEAMDRGIAGRVIVQFIVEEDGTLTEGKVVKPVDPQLDAEAIRIMRSMPKWEPGETRGKPIRMRFTFPVTFRLED